MVGEARRTSSSPLCCSALNDCLIHRSPTAPSGEGNHMACWGRHPKANTWEHKTLLSSCDISLRTKTVSENLRCSESCYLSEMRRDLWAWSQWPDINQVLSALISTWLPRKETWPASWNPSFIRQCTLDWHVLGTTQDSSDTKKFALLLQTAKHIGTISANWLDSQMFHDNTWHISCCLGWMMKSKEEFEVINSQV